MKLAPLLLLLLPMRDGVDACTSVLVPTPHGVVIGRTMELGIPNVKGQMERIHLHPRGTNTSTLRGVLPASHYGYLAVQITLGDFTLPIGTTEGINEVGLTVSLQTHVSAQYETDNASKAVAIGDLTVASYLLGCCATVAEAVSALEQVNVRPTPVLGSIKVGSVHFSLQDAAGSSRACEYIDGKLRVYDNGEVGVFTNDPSYEWHLGNLNQYGAYPTERNERPFALPATSSGPFTSFAVDPSHGRVAVPQIISHGTATKFLPGGYTPADRFVKMFLLKQLAVAHAPPKSLDEGIVLAEGLLNTVHIPRGAVDGPAALDLPETTNWACLKLPKAPGGPAFFYRTYDNMQWKKIELGRVDLSGAVAHAPIPLYEPGLGVRDATPVPQPAPA